MTSVWVVLIIDIDVELLDVIGVRQSEPEAVTLATDAARESGIPINRWKQVDHTPDQACEVAFESLPGDAVYFRLERHPVP